MNLSVTRMISAGLASMAAGAGALALAATPASAAVATDSSASENWAGYVAQNNNFSAVSGNWIEPAAKCTSGEGYSAFWVGLGGATGQSDALEQVGTQSDCSSNGQTDYYAWYELVPAAPVRLSLAVSPGDHLGGKVAVNGTQVTLTIWNDTTGKSVSTTRQTSNIDTSSAEWIAEAPSECDSIGNCQPMPLADFGTVKFTNAAATAGGHSGPISDAAWQAQAVDLDGSTGASRFGAVGVAYQQSESNAAAQTSTLSGNGSAFSVGWLSDSSQLASTSDGTGSSSSSGNGGYGGGDPYGYGSGYGYGYGYGGGSAYGYGGDGYGGYGYADGGGY